MINPSISFTIFFWGIVAAALILLIIDMGAPIPNVDAHKNFNRNVNLMVAVIIIEAGTLIFAFVFCKSNFITEAERAVLIEEGIWLVLIRKLMAIYIPATIYYVIGINNWLGQKLKTLIVVPNMDPLSPKPERLSIGVSQLGHWNFAITCVIVTLFWASFPSLAISRVNVYQHIIQRLLWQTTHQTIIVFIWVLMHVFQTKQLFYIFWTMVDNAGKAHSEKKNLAKAIWIWLISIPVTKLFTQIFVMKKYVWEDIGFSLALVLVVFLIIFISFVESKRTEDDGTQPNPRPHRNRNTSGRRNGSRNPHRS